MLEMGAYENSFSVVFISRYSSRFYASDMRVAKCDRV